MAADDLQAAGVRAVIEDLDEYLRGADDMNRATAGIGAAAVDAANQTSSAATGVRDFADATDEASQSSGGFESAVGRISSGIQGMLAPLGALAAGIGAAFAVKSGIDQVNALGASVFKLQQTTNLTAEEASKVTFMFDEYGVSAGSAQMAIMRLSRSFGTLTDLEKGTREVGVGIGKTETTAEKLADTLYQMGVRSTASLLTNMGKLADTFKAMPDGIEKTNLATQLFGRQGKNLIPLLNQGSEGLDEMGAKALAMGLVLDQKTTNALRKNALAQKEFHAALQGISVQIGLALLPVMTVLITLGTKLAVLFNEKVVAGIQAAGGAINEFLGNIASAVAPTIAGLWDTIGAGVEKLGEIFKRAFAGGEGLRALTDSTGKLRPLAVVAAYLGEAFRKALIWIQNTYKFLSVSSRVILAVIRDFNNLLLMWKYLPGWAQKLLIAVYDLTKMFRDMGTALLDLLGWGPLGKFGDTLKTVSEGPMQKFMDIADRLSKYVVPALSSAILVFMASLGVGTVIGFANSVGTLVAAFANIGPIKFFTGLVGDFLKLVAAPFKLIVNLLGDALEGIANIAKHLIGGAADLAGKVFSFTVNAVGNAIDYIASLVSGGLQRLLDANPLRQRILTTTEQGGAPGVSFDTGTQGQQAGQSWLKGFLKALRTPSDLAQVISNIMSGVIGSVLTLLVESQTISLTAIATTAAPFVAAALALAIAGYFAYHFRRELAARWKGIFTGSFAADIAFGPFGIIIGAVLGGVFGHAIADVAKKIPGMLLKELKALPGQLGAVFGGLAAVIAGALLIGLVALPVLALRELKKLDKAIAEGLYGAARAAVQFSIDLGVTVATSIADGITSGVPAILQALAKIPGLILDAFTALPGLLVRVVKAIPDAFEQIPALVRFTFTQLPGIVLDAIKSIPSLVVRIVKAVGQAFADGFDAVDKLTGGALRAIIYTIGHFFEGVISGFRDTWKEVDRLTGGALTDTVNGVTDKFTTMLDKITTIMSSVSNTVVGGWKWIVAAVNAVLDGFSSVGAGAVSALGDGIIAAVHGVARAIADVLQDVNDALDKVGYLLPGGLQDRLQNLINLLRGTGAASLGTGGGSTRPRPGGLGTGLAAGTAGPLGAMTQAGVGEGGTELAILRRGTAVLPAGSEVMPAGATSRLMSLLQALPALAGTVQGGGNNYSISVPVDARGLSFEDMRAVVHAELDRQLLSSRSRAARAGAPIGSMIG